MGLGIFGYFVKMFMLAFDSEIEYIMKKSCKMQV